MLHSITILALTLLPQGSLQMHRGHEMPYIAQDRPAIRKHILGEEKKAICIKNIKCICVCVCVHIHIKTIESVCICIYTHTHTLRLNRANKIRRTKNHKRAKV